MSATPGATNEYSRGAGASGDGFEADSGRIRRGRRRESGAGSRRVAALILAAALAGAALLVVAEFTTLYQAHLATRLTPFQTVTAGSHNSWAMIPIAVVAAGFGLVGSRTGSRLALLAVAVLGLVALLLALLHDLPDAHAVGLAEHNSISATTTPGVGLYLETLGAILLIATGGLGLALPGIPRRDPRSRSRRPQFQADRRTSSPRQGR